MQKLLMTLLCMVALSYCFGQQKRSVSGYLLTAYNRTLHDYTSGNNPWGIGLTLQAMINGSQKFKPVVELSGAVYLEDDKVLRSDPDGTFPQNSNDVDGMINLFAGASYHPRQTMYVSLLAGPCFIGRQTLAGIQPSFGFYFSKDQKWTGKVSYINVFNRTKIHHQDFGTLSIGIGLKLL